MIGPTAPAAVERFREVLTRRLGLAFEETRFPQLAELLRSRTEGNGQDCDAYLARLATEASGEELGTLARTLTVGETYFFRNSEQFAALREVVLPDRIGAGVPAGRLRFLSAGCASGEEAYSIAMCAREFSLAGSPEISVRGVDVNPEMLRRAESARYTPWSLRQTPPEVRTRWFREEGHDLVLNDSIRGAVRWDLRNLAEDDPELWVPESYDGVFCRNVLMYFSPAAARALVARIARALAPGAYLFLGHAETLRGLSQDFHLRHTHGTFYYQRKAVPDRTPQPLPSPAAGDGSVPPASLPGEGESWIQTIRRASDRIHALTEPCMALPSSAQLAAERVPGRPWSMADALELLRQERFSKALELVRSFPRESRLDPDVLLLHAVLLSHGGDLDAAEEMCRALLEIDELNAGAHYLLALCREGAGALEAAADRDRTAAYLDPGFAMPRLHLGLLARRAGDTETSRRELAAAGPLLRSEDPSRLLLFGGGFRREALVAMCEAEIRSLGRNP